MRILVITDHLPYPPSSGTSIRNYSLITRIAREHEVWLCHFAGHGEPDRGMTHLLQFCAGIESVKKNRERAWGQPLTALRYLLAGRPVELKYYWSVEMADTIRRLTSRIDFDVIDIVDSYMGLYLDALSPSKRRGTVLTFIDVVFEKYRRISKLEPRLPRKLRTKVYADTMRRWEPSLAGRFQRCITVSDPDRQLLLSSNPRLRIDVVPNGIDTKTHRVLPYESDKPVLIFVGNLEYRPNIDAMLYFCGTVRPHIRAAIPKLELLIVGLNPPKEIQQLAGSDVQVIGSVEDVGSYYQRSLACVVPLRAGGGTRLKILEAMAFGRPVVSTSIGCEGLEVVDGQHLLIADSPEEFAAQTIRLLTDKPLRESLIRRARELVVSRYDWDIIAQQLLQTYAEAAQ